MQGLPVESHVPVLRLSIAQYHGMRDAGILDEDAPIELLEGLLVPKMTKHPKHRLATRLVRSALERVVPGSHYVDSQEPITTDDSEPEPDVVVVAGSPRDYADRHPGPGDVGLVVEISDDSLERDRTLKLRLYARAGIPVYWIVNLRSRIVEVYEAPSGAAYARRAEFAAASDVPVVVGGRELARIRVDSVLP